MTEIQPDTVADHSTRLGDCGVANLGDTALVVCIERHRHHAALAEVYRRHGGSVDDLAARVCGSDRSGEVVHAVLLDLWHRPGRFEPDRFCLRTHLLVDAHALAVEMVRARPPRRVHGPMSLLRRTRESPHTSPEALAQRAGSHAWSLLSSLPEAQRTAIGLAYFCGVHSWELAELLRQSQGAVNHQIGAGLIELGRRASTEVRGVEAKRRLGGGAFCE